VQLASVFALPPSGFLWQPFGKRGARETCRSLIWRKEIAGVLEANLTSLEALAHGFVPSYVDRDRL